MEGELPDPDRLDKHELVELVKELQSAVWYPTVGAEELQVELQSILSDYGCEPGGTPEPIGTDDRNVRDMRRDYERRGFVNDFSRLTPADVESAGKAGAESFHSRYGGKR